MLTKIFIYQVFPRLFGNIKNVNARNGTITENGVGKFSSFSHKALSEIKQMGFTHIWYMGIIEHATQTDYSHVGIRKDNPLVVKGIAGSPYAIKDYYDVDPDLADNIQNRMDEFEELIHRTHQAGLKVIIDFVPNHVARQYYSDARPKKVEELGEKDNKNLPFAPDNNYYYIPDKALELQFSTNDNALYTEFPAKVTGNDLFDNKPAQTDWYETVKLNYGIDYLDNRKKYFTPIPDTWYKMRDILLFWASRGVDGFRCDMAELVPVEFWNWVITQIKSQYKPIIFIAEVYNPDEYRNYTYTGKFDYLYDKVGLYDTLRSVICGYRPSSDLTHCWQKLGELQPRMLNFLENHDEQRIASDFFAHNPFKAIPGMIVVCTMGINPVMIYSGQELGERGMDEEGFSGIDGRTSIFDYWSVDTLRRWYNEGTFGNEQLNGEEIKLREFYIRLLALSGQENSIAQGKFFDLMYANFDNAAFNPSKQYVYLRGFEKEIILVIVNFDDKDINASINIPDHAFEYFEIQNIRYQYYQELLSGNKHPLNNGLGNNFTISLEANSGKILKFIEK